MSSDKDVNDVMYNYVNEKKLIYLILLELKKQSKTIAEIKGIMEDKQND